MSKQDETGAAKAAPPKSQAPRPIEPIQGRSYVAPRVNAEPDRPSIETLRNIADASAEFDQAASQCFEAIAKGRNVNRVDQERWTYETKRLSEILRANIEHAVNKCKNSGMPAAELHNLNRRLETLDREWNLVCSYRDSISSKHTPAGTTRSRET